ncbi:MAG: hypothetical protein ETSY1_11980 [Candidatus Entotheonella factor]|uniref:Uncharacterized protein n=1 Tax=Entotheonella factor TaxID=1429438 RepID=W4LQR8_ENTF1|nr:DUF6364 family protein [Candidatus Entotheonella palauensis]ETX00230.1 MAG: hypothetical protein ETSY1_11980 [Candidatus Entotheonella factor]
MDNAILTVQLATQDIEFIEQYAKHRGATVSELIKDYIQSLQVSQESSLHPDIQKITGIVPLDIDAKAAYYQRLLKKHQ